VNGDKALRRTTIAAVTVVAVVAGWVSYRHALEVVSAHGQTGWVARAYPLTIDGMIYAASMVLLNSARHRTPAPRLAYLALGLGISATIAVNVTAGLAFGVVGAIVAAWPAPALVISYELLMQVIRSAGTGASAPGWHGAPEREQAAAPVSAAPVRRALPGPPDGRAARRGKPARRTPAADRESAVLAAMEAEPAITHAELARRMGVDEATIRRVRKRLTPVTDRRSQPSGHAPAITLEGTP
jgi:hypothetical protein